MDHRLRGFVEPSGGFPKTEDFCGRKRFSTIDARISEGLENLLRHKDCDFLLGKSKQPARFLGIVSGGKMAKRKQFPSFLGLGSFDWTCDSHLTKGEDVKSARASHEAYAAWYFRGGLKAINFLALAASRYSSGTVTGWHSASYSSAYSIPLD
jgi:hypothetical protein